MFFWRYISKSQQIQWMKSHIFRRVQEVGRIGFCALNLAIMIPWVAAHHCPRKVPKYVWTAETQFRSVKEIVGKKVKKK